MTTKTTLTDAEKHAAVDALAAAVATHLTGWTVQPRAPHTEMSVQHEAELVNADGLELTLAMYCYGLDPTKVHIAASKWPTYTEWDLQGTASAFNFNETGTKDGYLRDNTRTIQASDLRDPSESLDSITVTAARGAEVVAREIARRLIPDYERVYARCAVVASERQAYQDKTKAVWLNVCGITGGKVWRGEHYDVGGLFNVECRHSTTVRITANVTPEQLARLVAALKGTPTA